MVLKVLCFRSSIMDNFVIPETVWKDLSEENRSILELAIENLKLTFKNREQEYQLKVKQHQLELIKLEAAFKSENQTLKDQLCTVNLKDLMRDKDLNIRSFIKYVEEEHLSKKEGTTAEKFQTLAAENPHLLKKCKMNEKSFGDIFDKLMEKLNTSALPFFEYRENFILCEADLEHEELKLLGFIWCAVPLDRKKIYIRKLTNEYINLVAFIEE